MRVGIIGYGYVGKAIAYCYEGDDVVIRDPKLLNSADFSEFNNCDAVFVCVPSPSQKDGSCDTSILEQTIHDLLFVTVTRQIPIICKTTAPPSVYQRLLNQYPNIVHVPEFLTAANHIEDYVNTEYVVIGGNKEWCTRAAEILRYHLGTTNEVIKIVDIKTAALYKYMMNSYLATKVTFMNEFYKLAQVDGIDWNKIKEVASYDDRIGMTHMDVPGSDGNYGWGGACFPKDVSAIISEAKSCGLNLKLLENVVNINKEHRNND